jgi:hypothetical protein
MGLIGNENHREFANQLTWQMHQNKEQKTKQTKRDHVSSKVGNEDLHSRLFSDLHTPSQTRHSTLGHTKILSRN